MTLDFKRNRMGLLMLVLCASLFPGDMALAADEAPTFLQGVVRKVEGKGIFELRCRQGKFRGATKKGGKIWVHELAPLNEIGDGQLQT